MHEVEAFWQVGETRRIFREPLWNFSTSKPIITDNFSLFESSQSLFWASFGTIGLETFELEGIKSYTRFWGELIKSKAALRSYLMQHVSHLCVYI